MTVIGTYYFKLASDVVTDTELANKIKTDLDRILALVHQKYIIHVIGHACDTPIVSEMAKAKWGTNEILSVARASSVRVALEAVGVSVSLPAVVGFGDTKPVGTDKNLNRRVEVKVEFV
jgi:flagellar motor protein MotB